MLRSWLTAPSVRSPLPSSSSPRVPSPPDLDLRLIQLRAGVDVLRLRRELNERHVKRLRGLD
jgi:hypothetical protein